MSPPPVFNKPFLGGGVWRFLVIRFRFQVVSWNAMGSGGCCSAFHTWRLGGPPGPPCCSGSWAGSVQFLCCIIITLCVSLATNKQSAKRPLKTGWIFCLHGNLPRRGSHRASGLVPSCWMALESALCPQSLRSPPLPSLCVYLLVIYEYWTLLMTHKFLFLMVYNSLLYVIILPIFIPLKGQWEPL